MKFVHTKLAIAKGKARSIFEATNPGYRFLLRREGANGPMGRPVAPWHNAVLKTRQELDDTVAQVRKLGLHPFWFFPKNWDALAAVDCILSNTSPTAKILDAGAEMYSRVLPWLFLYGYTKLEGINVVFTNRKKLGPIIYKHGDVTATDYASETFDAVVCQSVVEHGVDLSAYFKEAARILKPGAILITSTDYWQAPIDTQGKQAFGVPVRIFTQDDIEQAIKLALQYGLVLTSKLDLSCDEKVVRWGEVDLYFTYVIFTLRKKL